MRPRSRKLRPLAAAAAALAVLAAPGAAAQGYDDAGYDNTSQAGYDSGYSYLRNLRGQATLVEVDSGDREAVEINQPVLAGDRLWVSPGSMVEVLLADGNLLRVDGDSEVVFARLAASPESRDEVTELVLVEGNAQLVVFADAAGRELPRVELPNGTVYVQEAGAYRLTAGRGWSQVLARSGWAEVATDRGSVVVRGGEEAVIEGGGRADVRAASYRDDLERWGERLDRDVADTRYVDRSLAREAAILDDYGSWIDDGDRYVWRPRVDRDWQPYRHGRWTHTPLGVTWVSSEPWGWAPYHYGTWNLHARHGWVWYPGTAFAPAWVYWYWGPSHVAWVPIGYYTHHYRPFYGHRFGFNFGVYGWAGGHWGLYNDWVFCPTGYFGRPFGSRHFWRGSDWRRHHHDDQVPRGIIAVDTRPLGRDEWRDSEKAMRALRSRPLQTAGRGELPDVTDFVARREALPEPVARRVFVETGAERRLAGTPLAPDLATATRPRAVARDGGVDGGTVGRGGRADATPRTTVRATPGVTSPGASGDQGVRRARPRVDAAPEDGGGVSGRPASGVRPRAVEPEDGGGTAPTVRPRRIEPREPAGGEGGVSGRPASGVRPRAVEPEDRGGAAPTARPRRIEPGEPAGGSSGAGVSPRRIEPRDGGTAVRPRAVEPRQPAGSAGAGATPRRIEPRDVEGGGAAVRPRTVEPRQPAGSSGSSGATRRVEPRERRDDGGATASPRRIAPREAPPRAGAAAPGAAARPRSVEPRQPAGDSGRPAVRRSSSARERSGDDRGAAVRAPAPRSVTPESYSRSPRHRDPSAERGRVTVPPRSERQGAHTAPPARRVLGGVRSDAPSRRPGTVRPSAPTRAPRASAPSSPPASRQRSVQPRSSERPSGSSRGTSTRSGGDSRSGRSSAGSRSSGGSSERGGGRARATRRGGGGGGD